jgi:hypothetical protein
MRFSSFVVGMVLGSVACCAQDPGLLGNIVTTDRAVAPANQTLTGAWAALGRRAAPPGMPVPPPAPIFFVFHSDGTMTGSGLGTDSAFSGVWLRVADRKFLVTYVVFNYNDARNVVSIAKIRLTTEIDAAGNVLQGNQEVLVVDTDGKVLFTALGGSHDMVRIAAEKPADFDTFLAK